jgi:hypothetical protein
MSTPSLAGARLGSVSTGGVLSCACFCASARAPKRCVSEWSNESVTAICQLFLHTVDSRSPEIDKSPFACSRRPTLGKIKLEEVARKLARAR